MASRNRHSTSGRAYVLAWLALLVLTALSFGASYIVPQGAAGLIAALGIAAIKAAVVMLVFMHLLEMRFASQLVIIVTIVFIVLLCLGVVADVRLR